jgi:hypothetical protein
MWKFYLSSGSVAGKKFYGPGSKPKLAWNHEIRCLTFLKLPDIEALVPSDLG